MLFPKKYKHRLITPEQEDKPFMIESIVFILLMVICACALVYGLVQLVMAISENISVRILP